MNEDKRKKMDEIRARRAAREAAQREAIEARDLADEEAIDALEEAHGKGKIAIVSFSSADPPLPGRIVIREPGLDYKPWRVAQGKNISASQKMLANEDLAKQVVLYPEEAVYRKMVERYPGLVDLICTEAIRFVGAAMDEKGKE